MRMTEHAAVWVEKEEARKRGMSCMSENTPSVSIGRHMS